MLISRKSLHQKSYDRYRAHSKSPVSEFLPLLKKQDNYRKKRHSQEKRESSKNLYSFSLEKGIMKFVSYY